MSAWGAVTRIAWRDIARHHGRSLLVVLLIALPIAAIVAAAAILRTTEPSQARREAEQFGSADLIAQGVSRANLDPYLPAGSIVEPTFFTDAQLLVDGSRPGVTVRGLNLDGLGAGALTLLEGNAPKGPGEVAITREVARIANVSIGGAVTLDEQPPARVVGIVENGLNLKDRIVVEDPLAVPPGEPEFASWLIRVPPGVDPEAVVAGTDDQTTGVQVISLYSRASGQLLVVGADSSTSMILVLGSLALVEAALVASAAFAVSIRRRQRELGLLAAAGATPRQLSATVLASAAVLGGIACVVGLGGGLAIAFAASPFLDQLTQRRNPPIVLDTFGLVAPAMIGFGAALVASIVPARTVARVPVLLSLSGRRPAERSAHRSLWIGLAVVAISVALALIGANVGSDDLPSGLRELLVISGAALGTLGFGACGPWLLERLDGLAIRLPLAGRVAFRDTARARSRNSPIVTAVLASVAATITIGSFTVSRNAENAGEWRPYLHPEELVVRGAASDAVGTELAGMPGAIGGVATSYLAPGSADPGMSTTPGGNGAVLQVVGDRQLTIELPGARDPSGTPVRWGDDGQFIPATQSAALPKPDLLAAAHAEDASGSLDAGRIVILWPDPITLDSVDVTITSFAPDGTENVHKATYPASAITTGVGSAVLPDALIPHSIATDLGLVSVDAQQYVVRYDHTVTQADVDAAAIVAGRKLDTFVDASLGPQRPDEMFRLLIVALALLFALSVTGVAIALGEAESRPEQRSLLALGAEPRLRRRMVAARAAVLALLAGVLAVPAGLLPAWSLLSSLRQPFAIPLVEILAAVALMPAVAVLGAWLLSRPIPDWNAFRNVRPGE